MFERDVTRKASRPRSARAARTAWCRALSAMLGADAIDGREPALEKSQNAPVVVAIDGRADRVANGWQGGSCGCLRAQLELGGELLQGQQIRLRDTDALGRRWRV